MIRKFSVTHPSQSTESPTTCSDTRPTPSPTSQIESTVTTEETGGENKDTVTKRLYAQSLESTENSDLPACQRLLTNCSSNNNLLLYPIGSDEMDTSTDGRLCLFTFPRTRGSCVSLGQLDTLFVC